MLNRYKTYAEYLLEDSSQFKKGEKIQIKNSGLIGIISDINPTTGLVVVEVEDETIETTKNDIEHIEAEIDYETDKEEAESEDNGIEGNMKQVGER